jgi:hypothetical protein
MVRRRTYVVGDEFAPVMVQVIVGAEPKGGRGVASGYRAEGRSGFRVGVLGAAAAGEEDQRRGRREVGVRSRIKPG